MIRITKTPAGPQLFLGPLRIHHFHFALAALTFGAWALWTDRHDFLNFLLYGRHG